MNIAIVIPVFRPDGRLKMCIERLLRQSVMPDRILLNILYENPVDREISEIYIDERIEIRYAPREEYDRAGSRDTILRELDSDVVIFMVQTAIPQNRYLVEKLTEPFKEERTAVVYGRHMTDDECSPIECCVRQFNYPPKGMIKSLEDAGKLGIRTFFNSNVCAAYKREIYMELGGFIRKTIFNEDMIFAAKAMKNGYAVCYAADARVIHSHNYTAVEQFHRNFDLAVSQADHPDVFSGIRSEGEGIRMVKDTARWLVKTGHAYLVPKLVVDSGFKYMGYLAGKRYKKLPKALVVKLSMNRNYWK